MNNAANNVDEYIAGFPKEVQAILTSIRRAIQRSAPQATETISYAMPTYVLHTNLVHFAAFKNHIGFYPVPSGIRHFQKELSQYKMGKGSIQFPLNEPMPLALISEIVKFRVKENEEKAARKKLLKTCKAGHKFYKTSDCPTCPICEKENKPADGFLSLLSAPARRSLQNNDITTLKKLSKLSEKEVLQLHGMGKASIPILREALNKEGMSFRQE